MITSATPAEARERASSLIWIFWVGAPCVAWVAHAFLGLAMMPPDVPTWVWAMVIAPLLEELAFRPLLQRGLQERLPAWLGTAPARQALRTNAGHLANALVALAFMAAHAPQQHWNALWWILPSLAIGEVWRQRQKLWPCVLMHAWFNASLAAATLLALR